MSKAFWITILCISIAWSTFTTIAFWSQAEVNRRMRDINAELYRDGVFKNDHIDRLQRELSDIQDMIDRILKDSGMLVFDENGREIK